MNSKEPRIFVLAGVNGSGKSSVGGYTIRELDNNYFNPDEAAKSIRLENQAMSDAEANGLAWSLGRSQLEAAIQNKIDFSFETTLGGNSISRLLQKAAESGMELHIWYAGLDSVERHLARVARRVSRGGHDIPERNIRQRWDASRLNLIHLLPFITRLRVYDNSVEADFALGQAPSPRLILAMESGKVVGPSDFTATPEWAKPIVAAAWKLGARG